MKIEVEDLKKINMLPGDTLVVKCALNTTSSYLECFANVFNKKFPKNQLMLIPHNMEIYKLISEEK